MSTCSRVQCVSSRDGKLEEKREVGCGTPFHGHACLSAIGLRTVVDFGRAFFELRFRCRYLESNGESFQDLFSSLMEKRYPSDFARVRPWGNVGDRKNDGYLRSRRMMFQSYAPLGMKLAVLKSKISKDFSEALPYWKQHIDVWIFVHNDKNGLPADVLKLLLDLSAQHNVMAGHWGYEQLLDEFKQLSGADMAALVGPGPTLADLVSVRVQEVQSLLQHMVLQPEPLISDVRPVPPHKLQHNQLSDGSAVLLKAGMTRAEIVKKYLRGLADQTRYDKVAAAFRTRYAELKNDGHPPDDIFAGLQRFVAGDEVASPTQQAATLAILAFFFEACEIFERPPDAAGVPS